MATGQGAQGSLGGLRRIGRVARAEPGRRLHEFDEAKGAQGVAQGVGGGRHEAVELVGGLERALTAERRATRRARIDSTRPVRALGTPLAVPACTARAAASASIVSDFPRRRVLRSGRSTSTIRRPAAARCRAAPAPQAPVPSTPKASTVPNPRAQRSRRRWPAEVVGNDSVARSLPNSSSTAATWTSPWVSIPTVTRRPVSAMVVIAIPFI